MSNGEPFLVSSLRLVLHSRGPSLEDRHMKQVTLRQARVDSGLTAEAIADRAGIHRTTLHRIESGLMLPKREIARRLFAVYNGRVPLGSIYDPEFAGEVRTP
jgi:DNA-binding XRE family transcriptional regulator